MTVPQEDGWRAVGQPGRLYEGARWLPIPGVFQWVDILGASLSRWAPEGGDRVETRSLDLEFVTVALPVDDDRQLVASRDRVALYSWEHDSLSDVRTVEVDPDVRFNDGGRSPAGELYVGTMSMRGRSGAGALYRVDDRELVQVLDGVGISNGLAWGDVDLAYYVDSLARQVSRLEFAGGRVGVRSPWVTFDGDDEPDGLTVGPAGEVLIALWRGRRVVVLDRDGRETGVLRVPAAFPTSVAVGHGLVLVTTAAHTEPGVPPGPRDGYILARDYGSAGGQ